MDRSTNPHATPATGEDPTATTWWVEIMMNEVEGDTRALAHLHGARSHVLTGTGMARLNPEDRDVPEIGAELAAARALLQLAEQLLRTAATDIAHVTHEPVTAHDLG
jgi:hypothetical protein